MTTKWKFQKQTFGAVNASTFRKLMARKELSASELIAREIIQNSEDAAQKFRKELKREDILFRMEFTFRRLEATDKTRFFEQTGVDGIIRYSQFHK